MFLYRVATYDGEKWTDWTLFRTLEQARDFVRDRFPKNQWQRPGWPRELTWFNHRTDGTEAMIHRTILR